jgi:uncharacterized protein (DUF1810 family)
VQELSVLANSQRSPKADGMRTDFQHFVEAQSDAYRRATTELRHGQKQTHWMWFIFPQLAGLGRSDMAKKYALASLEEARAYAAHPVLGPRLLECVDLLQDLPTANATAVFGDVDAMKLHSCLTLFTLACPDRPIFKAANDRWFKGELDEATMALI